MDDVLAALNFVVAAHRAGKFRVCAANLSLGTAAAYSAPCDGGGAGAFEGDVAAALWEARSSGILPVAAAGNGANPGALSAPACAPAAAAVGATYDANVGAKAWASVPACRDATTYPNKVACFRCGGRRPAGGGPRGWVHDSRGGSCFPSRPG
jgi:hypothetical protein